MWLPMNPHPPVTSVFVLTEPRGDSGQLKWELKAGPALCTEPIVVRAPNLLSLLRCAVSGHRQAASSESPAISLRWAVPVRPLERLEQLSNDLTKMRHACRNRVANSTLGASTRPGGEHSPPLSSLVHPRPGCVSGHARRTCHAASYARQCRCHAVLTVGTQVTMGQHPHVGAIGPVVEPAIYFSPLYRVGELLRILAVIAALSDWKWTT
jgi:hypothetical protein